MYTQNTNMMMPAMGMSPLNQSLMMASMAQQEMAPLLAGYSPEASIMGSLGQMSNALNGLTISSQSAAGLSSMGQQAGMRLGVQVVPPPTRRFVSQASGGPNYNNGAYSSGRSYNSGSQPSFQTSRSESSYRSSSSRPTNDLGSMMLMMMMDFVKGSSYEDDMMPMLMMMADMMDISLDGADHDDAYTRQPEHRRESTPKRKKTRRHEREEGYEKKDSKKADHKAHRSKSKASRHEDSQDYKKTADKPTSRKAQAQKPSSTPSNDYGKKDESVFSNPGKRFMI
jgi:hypothetical protein